MARTGTAPKGFNNSLLYFLPKIAQPTATDLRPLNVPNADNRIISSTLKQVIQPCLNNFLSKEQFAFLKGRRIEHAIRQLNDKFQQAQRSSTDRLFLFVDFRKAYDMISHKFIFALLEQIGLPSWFSNTVRALLSDMVSYFTKPFATDHFIHILSGIKQGCPLAPLIFIIVIDTLIHYLKKIPQVDPIVYADDLAVDINNDLNALNAIKNTLDLYTAATGSPVNYDKTVLLSPLRQPSDLMHLVETSDFPTLKLANQAKHLGVMVGRLVTPTTVYQEATKKFTRRIHSYQPYASAFPLKTKILISNCYLIPIFSFLQQFFIIPDRTLKDVKLLLSYFLKLPLRLLPVLSTPHLEGGFTTRLRHLEADTMAAITSGLSSTDIPPPSDDDNPISIPGIFPHMSAANQPDMRRNQLNALCHMEQFFHTIVEPGDSRKAIYEQLTQTTDFAHETLFVPVCPKDPYQWPHSDSAERNLCRHDPLSICPHTENFVKNLKLISTQLKPRALPDHLRIFQIKLYTQSSFLRTNSAASYFAQVANVCPICHQGQDNLHKHILKTCTPVKAAKKKVASRLNKPFLANLSALGHSLGHSLRPLLNINPKNKTPDKTQAQAAEAVIKLNKGIWNVRCFLSKSQNRDNYTTSERIEKLLVLNLQKSIMDPNYFQVIPLAEEPPMS